MTMPVHKRFFNATIDLIFWPALVMQRLYIFTKSVLALISEDVNTKLDPETTPGDVRSQGLLIVTVLTVLLYIPSILLLLVGDAVNTIWNFLAFPFYTEEDLEQRYFDKDELIRKHRENENDS